MQVHQQKSGFLDNLVTSDEAIFSQNSEVYTHNVVRYSRYDEEHAPDYSVEHCQGAPQIRVWVGLFRNRTVLGPHFVRGNLDTGKCLRIVKVQMK